MSFLKSCKHYVNGLCKIQNSDSAFKKTRQFMNTARVGIPKCTVVPKVCSSFWVLLRTASVRCYEQFPQSMILSRNKKNTCHIS